MTDIRIGPFGPLALVDIVVLAWFTLTAVSVAYVAWDATRDQAPGWLSAAIPSASLIVVVAGGRAVDARADQPGGLEPLAPSISVSSVVPPNSGSDTPREYSTEI